MFVSSIKEILQGKIMVDILSQEEINSLLDVVEEDIIIDNIEDYLFNKSKEIKEDAYSLFEKDIAVSRFSTNPNALNVLDEIYEKNKKSKMGNKKIPNTNIELVNFSQCPYCEKVWSMEDLTQYYKNPYFDQNYTKKEILREDTSIMCKCNNRFNPSLLIMDATTKEETQFLCRMQTIDAIEKFYLKEFNRDVLTRDKGKIKRYPNKEVAISSNILIDELALKPTLVTNYIQYSTAPHILKFLDSDNKNQLLYGQKFIVQNRWR